MPAVSAPVASKAKGVTIPEARLATKTVSPAPPASTASATGSPPAATEATWARRWLAGSTAKEERTAAPRWRTMANPGLPVETNTGAASLVATRPRASVAVTWKRPRWWAEESDSRTWLDEVAPAMGRPSWCHWYWRGDAPPVASASRTTRPKVTPVWAVGWRTKDGGGGSLQAVSEAATRAAATTSAARASDGRSVRGAFIASLRGARSRRGRRGSSIPGQPCCRSPRSRWG